MANLFKVTVTQQNGNPFNQPKEYAFFAADVLILEDHQNAPNNAYVEYATNRFYTNATVEDIINAANQNSTEQFEATIVSIDGHPFNTSLKAGFPIKGVQLSPETTITGANSKIVFNGKTYYATETLDTLVTESNSGLDPVSPVSGANPTGLVGFTAVNGNSTQFIRSDGAPALDPSILTVTGEANKIPKLDNGGTLVLQNSTQRVEYGADSIFMYGPNASWVDIDASGMEIDIIGGGTTIHLGLDGIDAADQPITTNHVPANANDLINKQYLDAQLAGISSGIAYKGSWNAATNTPTLTDGTGTNGDMYKVSVAGSRDLGGGVIVFEVGDHVVYIAGTDNKWENFGSSEPVPANPTASIGLTAKNGTSANFMRNDAAPPLDQSIAPTWTGAHIFGAQSGNSNPTVQLSSINPQFELRRSDAGVDSGRWNFGVSPTQLTFRTLNDAGNANQAIWTITRAANAATQQQWFIAGTQLLNLIAAYFQVNVPTINVTGIDGVKLWLAKYTGGTGHNNAPTAIGATSNYLQIGGREYGNNGYGGIGFGYVSAMTDHPCVWVGYQEKNTTGSTSGDFLVALRNATTNTPPVEAFRITQAGAASFVGSLTVGGTITADGVVLRGVVASDGKNAQAANINSPTFYAVPASGMYRVSAFVVLTQAATTTSVLPSCSVSYTEAISNTVVQDMVTQTANTNTKGLHSGGSVIINALQGSSIGYITSNYASSGATAMQYSIQIKVEFLG